MKLQALRAHWSRWRRVLIALFLLLVAALLWRYARLVDWRQVVAVIRETPPPRLALGAAISLCAYGFYCGFDLLAKHYTGHALRWRRVLAIAFVSYAFNLNLGAVVGGIGFRYRLYSGAGLRLSTITRIVMFAIVGNWSGFLLLGGLTLVSGNVSLPPGLRSAASWLQPVGWLMLATVAAGLSMCAFARRRRWSLRGHEIELPPLPIALVQLLLASASWLSMAAIIGLLMPGAVGYPLIVSTLLLSVVANLVIRVPANLGVLEAVFIGTLGNAVPIPQILAALLSYRALFHIGPLLLALPVYAGLETRRRRH